MASANYRQAGGRWRMNALAIMPPAPTGQESDFRNGMPIFDAVPSGHTVFAVKDHQCLPFAQVGEVLVIEDAPRTYPVEGQWFLIQWISQPTNDWERATVRQTVGIPYSKNGIWGHKPPNNRGSGVLYCGDFGFSWDQMTDHIRGPVVGLYRPHGTIQ